MVNFKKLRQMIEIKGNGNIVSRTIQVSSFVRLHLAANGLIELIQSDEEKVVIESDENLQDYFEAVNSGRTLYLSSEGKFRKPAFSRCHIKVYLRQVNVLYVRCDGGDVICHGPIVLSDPLEIKIQSVGNTSLNIQAPAIKLLSQCQGNVVISGACGNLEIKNQSEGNFSSLEMKATELSIRNMSEGNVEVYADKHIAISHYGEGEVRYYGNAVLKDVKQYGSGAIRHMGPAFPENK
jgi:putative autotransporter adhesin-like protein